MNVGASARGRTAIVVGGGVAGLAAACALAEAGLNVTVVERRPGLGGRATSFRHPGVDEVIDNGQHVLFGCCTNVLGFYRRIGMGDRIRWTRDLTLIEPDGRRTKLGPVALPAPLHSLPRFVAARAFSWRDKWALARAFRSLLQPAAANSTETLGAWLARHGQTAAALDRFWRLVIASALNADIDAIAVPYAAKVIRELFLNSAEAGAMGLSTVPLGELHGGAADFLRRRAGTVLLNSAAESATWDAGTAQWTVITGAGAITAGVLVLALPFAALARLLPGLPPAAGAARLASQLARHQTSPICSVHLWYDRVVTELDHAVLLDGAVHWMFNKSRLQPSRRGAGSYLELLVSASRRFANLSGDEAIAQAAGQLPAYFPAARHARVEKAAFIRERHATFDVPPGIDSARPPTVSPWPNCLLAGDWIATGWPSTMEGAARSGHLAAEAVCRIAGAPRRFLEPDLRPRGFMALAGARRPRLSEPEAMAPTLAPPATLPDTQSAAVPCGGHER